MKYALLIVNGMHYNLICSLIDLDEIDPDLEAKIVKAETSISEWKKIFKEPQEKGSAKLLQRESPGTAVGSSQMCPSYKKVRGR